MSEGENPTRRYKWFRPRQAMQGGVQSVGLTQTAIGLYNNSTGSHHLVVRALRCSSSHNPDTITFLWQRGSIGGNQTHGIPLVGGEAELPGIILDNDLAAFPNGPYGYTFSSSTSTEDAWWEQPFPFFVIPPNSTLFGVSGFGAATLQVVFLWECVFPDELDFLYY